MTRRNRWVRAIPASLLIAHASGALAGDATPLVYGQSIGNWGHTWWQWVATFKVGEDPLSKTGAVDCGAGQSGKVWFLVGNFGGKSDRSCTIKRGRALFFPIFNGVYWTALEPSVPEDCTNIRNCRSGVAAQQDRMRSWTCTLNGNPCVYKYQVVRGQSSPRPFFILPGTMFTDFGYKPGIRRTSVADGTWVMLDPLPIGSHTLAFSATAPDAQDSTKDFKLEVTYQLTVE